MAHKVERGGYGDRCGSSGVTSGFEELEAYLAKGIPDAESRACWGSRAVTADRGTVLWQSEAVVAGLGCGQGLRQKRRR